MATRIVCVETLHPHRHITHVGTGSDPSQASQRWDVLDVRRELFAGKRFYTEDPVSGKTADVEPYDAPVPGGVVKTIRSTADAIPGNNLDNMRVCHWK
jgi:Protein of unknown function (DUF3892)